MIRKLPDILRRAGRFCLGVVNLFVKTNCVVRASGLAYSSLLALVPLAALLLSIFTFFGSYESVAQNIQDFLIHTLVPAKQEDILSLFYEFTSNTRALGALGLLLFLLTSVFMLNTIESNFNQIWGCPSNRGIVGRFTSYTSILVTGSILIAASFSVSQAFLRYFSLSEISQLATLYQLLLKILPTLFIALTFFLMNTVIPSARVQFSSALTGAFAGAVFWEIAKIIFGAWANSSVRFSVIYGSLALIPIFLIWLYIAWSIILLSLVITYVHQYQNQGWTGALGQETNCRQDLLVGLEVFLSICRSHRDGEAPPAQKDLASQLSLPAGQIAPTLDLLNKKSLIHRAGENGDRYVPAQTLENLPVSRVIQALLGDEPELPSGMTESRAFRISRDFSRHGLQQFDDRTLADILREGEI